MKVVVAVVVFIRMAGFGWNKWEGAAIIDGMRRFRTLLRGKEKVKRTGR